MVSRALLALLVLVSTPVAAAHDKAIVREQRSVMIGGVKEVWRLIWRDAPRDNNSCGLVEPEMATTCPCSGAAYAQVGDLVLERKRPGMAPEYMRLTPLFAGSDMLYNEKGSVAMLARWQARLHDIENIPTPAAIRRRPAVPIMHLRDYNHDGVAGEFLLQIDTLPCGKHLLVAVGTTRDNPHLHALTSAAHPERPLALFQWQWDALAQNPRPGKVVSVQCDDHGAETETAMLLHASHGRIHATRITSTCLDMADANSELRHATRFHRKVIEQVVM